MENAACADFCILVDKKEFSTIRPHVLRGFYGLESTLSTFKKVKRDKGFREFSTFSTCPTGTAAKNT